MKARASPWRLILLFIIIMVALFTVSALQQAGIMSGIGMDTEPAKLVDFGIINSSTTFAPAVQILVALVIGSFAFILVRSGYRLNAAFVKLCLGALLIMTVFYAPGMALVSVLAYSILGSFVGQASYEDFAQTKTAKLDASTVPREVSLLTRLNQWIIKSLLPRFRFFPFGHIRLEYPLLL